MKIVKYRFVLMLGPDQESPGKWFPLGDGKMFLEDSLVFARNLCCYRAEFMEVAEE